MQSHPVTARWLLSILVPRSKSARLNALCKHEKSEITAIHLTANLNANLA